MLIRMVYQPSPKQIEEECERIRRGWSVRDERKRRVNKRNYGYQMPVISISDLPQDTRSWIDSVNRMDSHDRSGE